MDAGVSGGATILGYKEKHYDTAKIKENITVKSEVIKKAGIPVGQKKIEYITAGIGESVNLKYNPENPKKAYLKDNIGKYV